jgi:hypothetical protein
MLIKQKRNCLGPAHMTSSARGHLGPPGHSSSAPMRPCTCPEHSDHAPVPSDRTPRLPRAATVKPTVALCAPVSSLSTRLGLHQGEDISPSTVTSHPSARLTPSRAPGRLCFACHHAAASRRRHGHPVHHQAFPKCVVLERQVTAK